MFNDNLCGSLPYLPPSHRLRKEWRFRADTMKRFLSYVRTKTGVLSVLDLGCGNGWFIRHLKKERPDLSIWGLEVNSEELGQAARLSGGGNVSFIYGDMEDDILEPGFFDMIILNASVQYFPDLGSLIFRLLTLLKEKGEIHILDSPFYEDERQRRLARERSDEYYARIGCPEMSSGYFHHCPVFPREVSAKLMYDPVKLVNRALRAFGKPASPFPWYLVTRRLPHCR